MLSPRNKSPLGKKIFNFTTKKSEGVHVDSLSVSSPSLRAGSPIRHSATMPKMEGAGNSEQLTRSPSHSPLLDIHRNNTSPRLGRVSPTPGSRSPFRAVQIPPLSHQHSDGSTTSASPAIGISHDDDTPATAPVDASRASPIFHAQRSRGFRSQSVNDATYYASLVDPDGLLSEGKLFNPNGEKKDGPSTKLSKRESLKVQKRHYRKEKKRAAKELLSTLKDPTVIVMADWLKVRGTLKSWTKLWCVLKPGLLVLYKSQKQKCISGVPAEADWDDIYACYEGSAGQWVGTILLNTCELIERPSKKDGFCFKLYHPLDQSIWATKGPKGESIGAITQPLPYSYLIFRCPSEQAGKCWMDALELALRCSSLLMRTMTREKPDNNLDASINSKDESGLLFPNRLSQWDTMNESDCERHFHGINDDELRTDKEEGHEEKSDSESEDDEEEKETFDEDLQPLETPYHANVVEELGQQGDASQTEEVAEENKSLIWMLVKQVRPGMDLSKVVLPTFILEPRSFLDKLSDYYYHADFLSDTVLEEDPYSRIKGVVRWYLSGFYKKPRGLKKPYNPILGETFRCYWKHSRTGSRTFYISEQISHHPPVSAFYVTNRQDGFSMSGSILAKSKFYGNSVSAIMDGCGRLTFLKRGEDYTITMPYAHCKGILIGTLTMELGGKVTIDCEKTGYRAELEYKLKPFLGSGEASNRITGKIKLGDETLATIDGKWDQEIEIKDKCTGESSTFWNPTDDIKRRRLTRYTVPVEVQTDRESERLWVHVSEAINDCDQNAATQEKSILEDCQRREAKERKAKMEEWVPRLFERDEITGDWVYKYADLRPWDPMNDLLQYENSYVVQTKTRHRMPVVRTTSITNVDESLGVSLSHKRTTSLDLVRQNRLKRASVKHRVVLPLGSGSSSPEPDMGHSDTDSDSAGEGRGSSKVLAACVRRSMEPLMALQKETNDKMAALQGHMLVLQRQVRSQNEVNEQLFTNRDVFLVGAVLILQLVLLWLFK